MTSTLAEIARAEAEEAELPEVNPDVQPDDPEEGEAEEADDQPEPLEQPDTPEAPTPEQIEARGKAWERERTRHMRELQKRDEYRYAQSEVCLLCEGHGLYWPVLGEPGDTLRREAIVTALGGQAPLEYRDDEATVACERCGALGMLRTGSKVPNQETHTCPDCNGQGWRSNVTVGTVSPIFAQPSPGNGAATVPPTSQGAPDAWGRPPGHKNYGVLPSMEV